MTRYKIAAAVAALGAFAIVAPAEAAHRHVLRYSVPAYDVAPYEPAPVGLFFARHSNRCEYPNGWNTTDFVRSINGIPSSGERLIATDCVRAIPFAY